MENLEKILQETQKLIGLMEQHQKSGDQGGIVVNPEYEYLSGICSGIKAIYLQNMMIIGLLAEYNSKGER